ncbi:EF-hand domain-containing protein [Candidatus Methylobacter favarea]|nr:EF-hand domain-containing protein [Candidatus Methylobacter favarea]
MKTKKIIHEASNSIKIDRLEVRSLQFFKIFTLPVWVAIVITIGLGSIAKPVRSQTAGTEDVKRNYRYIKPQGVENKTETGNSGTKKSTSAKTADEAKKTNQPEHGATSGTGGTEKSAQQGAKESSGTMKEPKKAQPGEQTRSSGTETAPLNSKESSADKRPDVKKPLSGSENTATGGTVGQEPKGSSAATVKEPSGQTPPSANPPATTGQNPPPITPPAKQTKAASSTSEDQKPQIDHKIDPVSNAAEGEKAFLTFDKADKNGDHYVTKDEIQDFPELLEVFDKVDAGKDGKLEQHEYQNLGMETKREGEIP